MYFKYKPNVFQNAMRATMEYHADKGVYPPVQVHVTLGSEDLTVKVNAFSFIFLSWYTGMHIISRRHNLLLGEINPIPYT